MLRHLLITFGRTIRKNTLSFFIKSIGLILSLSITILISSFVYDEISYDKFQPHLDNIFRITSTSHFNGTENSYSRTPLSLAEKVSELKSISQTARIFERSATISLPDTDIKFNEPNVWFGDSTLADVLAFSVIKGNITTALNTPNKVILSETAALKYFNSLEVLGKNLLIENRIPVEIEAVVENYPTQSTFQFDFILPFNHFLELENPANVEFLTNDWLYTPVYTLVKTNFAGSVKQINEELNAVVETIPDTRARENISYSAQPLAEAHLYSHFTSEQTNQRIVYLYVFVAVGLTLFIIAILNFISLTSAEWLGRNKELRIRRMIGSSKTQVTGQFLFETFLFSLFLLPLSILTAYIFLPYFNSIIQKQLTPDLIFAWPVFAALIVCVIIYVGCTALFLSIPSVKEQTTTKFPSRFALLSMPPSLLAQTILTLIISCFSITTYRQLTFIENKSLGYQKNNLIIVPLFSENFNAVLGQITGDFRGRMNHFEEEVLKYDEIESISCSTFQPGQGAIRALIKTDSLRDEDNVFISLNSVDYDFLETYKINLIDGRNFSRDFGTDHLQAFIINEEAVKILGFKTAASAIGKNIEAVGKQGQIVGVMENFHFEGLQNPISPLLLEVAAWKFTTFSIRLNDQQAGLEILNNKWKEIFPETVFQYTFLENDLAANYQFESSLMKLTQAISIMTVLLSLLGMYASASHYAVKKVKELTMRRVLGATSPNLIRVFTKPFLRVIVAGFIIATPIVWKLSEHWLTSFAYHTTLKIDDFIVVFLVALALVVLVLLQQLVRVVSLNPVDNLRRE